MAADRYIHAMRHVFAFLAGCSLIAVLAGCVPPVAADPHAAPPSETTATQVAEPAVSPRPELAFDGDCRAIFAEAEIGDLVGTDVRPGAAPESGRSSAVEVLGGTSCTWTDEDGVRLVWLTVIPASGLHEVIAAASTDQPRCYGSDQLVGQDGACSFSAVAGGYWLAGVFTVASSSGKRATEGIDALSTLLARRAATVPANIVERPHRMWTEVGDCAGLADRVDTAAVLGSEALSADRGSVGGEAGPGFYGALDALGHEACIWTAADGEYRFETELLPGAGWVVPRLVDQGAATSLALDRVLAAAGVDRDGAATSIFATDGVNLVSVTIPTGKVDSAQLPALVSALIAGASSH